MKNTFKKITALTLSILTVGAFTACNKDKPEDVSDSQESSSSEMAEDNKTVINIGVPGANPLVLSCVNSFNSKNESYQIEIIDYSKGIEDDMDGTKAMQAFKLALTTDEAPDIIALSPMYMTELLSKDMLADLYPLMDSCEGVKREDFLPNVLEGFEVNGEMPAISNCFTINTAVAKTKFVGEECENWTPQQAIDIYNKYSDSMEFINCNGFEGTFYAFMLSTGSCIDIKNKTCNFNNPDFLTLLDFLREADFASDKYVDVMSMSDEDRLAFFTDQERQYINDKTLISEVSIRAIDHLLGQAVYSDFGGEDVTFVGKPSDDGNGAATDLQWMYAITENCSNKEGAWEFINELFSEKIMQTVYEERHGLPVLTEYLDKQRNNTDKNDEFSIYSELFYPTDFENGIYITDETVQQIYDYIVSVEINPYYDHNIGLIVNEECGAVIEGEKTAEEAAEILDNRVSIYLSERS